MAQTQRINPLIPDSVGALLAEEWTIDPRSTLPSFLEMTMIEESRRSGWLLIKSALAQIQPRLDRWVQSVENLSPGERSASRLHQLCSRSGIPKVVRFVSENFITPYGPEIRFLFFYWLERRSLLSSSAATVTEALYGGKRVKVVDPKATGMDQTTRQAKLASMSKQDGIRLALLLALGRYLTERGEWMYQQLAGNQAVAFRVPSRFQKLFRFVYPFLYTSAKGLNLIQRWKYLFGQSVFFDPFSQWLNLVVRRVVAADASSSSTGSSGAPKASNAASVTINPRSLVQAVVNLPRVRTIAMGVFASAVGISWLARLQTTRLELRRKRNLLENSTSCPPPPKPLPGAEIKGTVENCPPTHCPLCRSPHINPTASTSGYVFCLTCLISSLRENPVCPITGKACPESSVVRLFEPHDL